MVFAPIRFRLKCGPLGAPFPVRGVVSCVAAGMANGVAARIAKTRAVMVVASRVFSFMFLQDRTSPDQRFSNCEVFSEKRAISSSLQGWQSGKQDSYVSRN